MIIDALFKIVLTFFIVGILSILYNSWCQEREAKKYQKQKRETDVEAEKEYIEAKVNQEDDPQTILKVVEGRKQRARDLRIEEGIMELFFGGGFGCCHFANVSIVSDFKWEAMPNKRFFFTLKGRKYIAQVVYGPIFELFVDDKKVLAIKMFCEYVPPKGDGSPYDDGYEKWSCVDMESFIEGEWIGDLRDLIKQIDIDKKEARRKEAEDPERIKKLKEGFGI